MERIDDLRALIAAVRRRWLTAVVLRAVGIAAAAAAVPLVSGVIAVWSVAAEGAQLILLTLVSSVAAVLVGLAVLRRLPGRRDDVQTARFIEERAAEQGIALNDALVTAVQAASALRPAPFAGLVVAGAAARLEDVPVERIVTRRALGRSGLQAAGGLACLVLAAVAALPALGRAADATWLAMFPHRIRIDVQPGNARVAAGQALIVRASLVGKGAALKGVAPSLVVSADGQERTVPMSAEGDEYQFVFDSVDRSFAYQVVAAAAASRQYAVTAIFPPRIRRIDVTYEYPSFSGLPARTHEDAGDIYGPQGTRVRISVHADKPIAAGQLALSGGHGIPLRVAGERVMDGSLTLSKDDSYRIRLTDHDGLRSGAGTEYFIRLMEDRPPEVRILRPSADQSITPLEEVSIEARADDDHGLSRFELVYAVAGRRERSVAFASVTGTNVARLGAYVLAAEDLAVQPGDVISYYARAVDVGRGKRPTETRSDIFFLEVKPFGEEFVAAQSQAMGGGGAGAQIEALIAAQKEIINATWNLDRRAAAGGSREDVEAVAQAQAELKSRAEQMAAGRRGFRNRFVPQQIAPPQPRREAGAADPVGAAVAAMEKAVEQLRERRTRDALRHEMAALQGLLQAQADVRRRQVQQSASAAGQGATGRVGQDLSALFDRELQRQQRTNYESRSRIDERPDGNDGASALDRIRDLARRQEDLSRRQQELSRAGLSEEEVKRQLETLTREQEMLRARAEEIERQMGAPGNRGGRGGKGQEADGQARNAMRGASERMQQAAGDLKRQDAAAAADRSKQAADALRQAEQQLRGGSSDARERAAGELQLEAQQVAEAQRRVAAESARIEGAGAPASDALRRLAAEKDRLADRVDELQRATQQLARQAGNTPSDPAGRAREAASVLEREQIGRRMRDGAKQMRDASAANGSRESQAQAEQELARAVDRAADALAGRQQGAADLSGQLERTRALRDRLNRLEQQLREAEAREGQRSANASGQRRRAGADGRQGRDGAQGSAGSGQSGEVQRLRDEYRRELERARDALARLEGEPRSGQNMGTPETHEFSRSAPGTEAFKQDYSSWDQLRRSVDLAMERYEASASQRLTRSAADRFDAGGSERVPDAYGEAIARYYQSLARLKK